MLPAIPGPLPCSVSHYNASSGLCNFAMQGAFGLRFTGGGPTANAGLAQHSVFSREMFWGLLRSINAFRAPCLLHYFCQHRCRVLHAFSPSLLKPY